MFHRKRLRRWGWLVLTSLWLWTSLSGQPAEIRAQATDIFRLYGGINGPGANALALGDFNNDGRQDLYVGLAGSHNKVHFGLSNTSIDAELINSITFDVTVGDMDNDGYLDVVTANEQGDYDTINYNTGLGNFVIMALPDSQLDRTVGVELGDLDNDGDLDILFVTDQKTYIRVNQGGAQGGQVGIFLTGQTLATTGGTAATLADFDQDNDLDVATIINGGQAIQLWINEGGTFQVGVTLPFEPGVVVTDLVAGLLDGDSLPDLYIATAGEDLIGLNNGFNSFNPGQTISTGNTQEVVLNDVDLDGDLDVIIAVWDYGNNGDQVWLNEGGTFSLAQILQSSRSFAVAVGDVDDDKLPDIVLANLEGPRTIWLNQLDRPGVGLSVQITGENPFIVPKIDEPQQYVDFKVTVTNHTDEVATNVWVEVSDISDLPLENLTLFPICTTATSCHLGALPPGESQTFSVGGWANTTEYMTLFQLEAQVRGDEIDPDLRDNQDRGRIYYHVCIRANCFVEELLCSALSTTTLLRQAANFILDVPTYYRLRDEIMDTTASGQHYIDLYYTHDAELQTLILEDNALFDQGLGVFELWQPHLQALVDGQGDSAVITTEQVAAASGFLFNLSQVASPELQQIIDAELARLGPLSSYVGLTMDEASLIVLGYTAPNQTKIYLPLVIK